MAVLHDSNHPVDASSGSEGLPDGSGQKEQPVSAMKALMEIRAQKMLDRELRGDEEKGKTDGGDTLAATIVKAALDTTAKATDHYQKLAERNDEGLQKAREDAEKTRIEMNAIVAQQIGAAIERLEKMRDEMKSGNTTGNFIEQFKQFKELIGLTSQPQSAGPHSSVGDASVAITLEKMRMDHEAVMKRMDMEMAKMSQDLQIRLAEFSDNRETKKREYEDSRKFRENAFTTVNDIVAAASAGFANKTGGVASDVGATTENAPASQRNKIVPGFQCKDCGTPIAVPDGAKEVVCPNPKCGTKYTLVPGS